MVIGGTLATGLFAALGLGLGAIVRNQVGAIIGGLVYMLRGRAAAARHPDRRRLDRQVRLGRRRTGSLTVTNDPSADNVLEQVPGGLLLPGYVAVFCIAGIV